MRAQVKAATQRQEQKQGKEQVGLQEQGKGKQREQ
jgi:hypothetical protein